MASLDAGLPDSDVTANGVTSSRGHCVAMTTALPKQPITGARFVD